MTDYSDLVWVLRRKAQFDVHPLSLNAEILNRAADAIETQTKEIAELEKVYEANLNVIGKKLLQIGDDGASLMSEYKTRIRELEAALKLYENALEEAEAIFGGEYADAYGPMFKLAMDARTSRKALGEKE